MLCDFPKILSNLRRSRGISQKKAAEELGISPALLSHYENGIRECGLDFLLRIAEYYSVSCDYLLGKSEIKNPIVYETENEALAVDQILKTAKDHNDAAYNLLSEICRITTYRMSRALCDTAMRSNSFTFKLEGVDYHNICSGVENTLYAKMSSLPKEKKKLPRSANDITDSVIKKAEKKLSKSL